MGGFLPCLAPGWWLDWPLLWLERGVVLSYEARRIQIQKSDKTASTVLLGDATTCMHHAASHADLHVAITATRSIAFT